MGSIFANVGVGVGLAMAAVIKPSAVDAEMDSMKRTLGLFLILSGEANEIESLVLAVGRAGESALTFDDREQNAAERKRDAPGLVAIVIAAAILGVPGGAVSVERAWSVAGDVLTQRRLVCCCLCVQVSASTCAASSSRSGPPSCSR